MGSLKAGGKTTLNAINKTSLSEKIEFIIEDWFSKYTNITTKLKWKLFTKGIKRPSEEAWVLMDRVSNSKRMASTLI